MQLAQLNIARLVAPAGDPKVAPFFAALDRINTLGEQSPGFVWRLKDDVTGDATSFNPYDDDRLIINLSVWESVAALQDFVFRSDHAGFMRRRREWFERTQVATTCLWWIDDGEHPTLSDATDRLEHLRVHGPTAQAFGFAAAEKFPPGSHSAG